MRVNGKKPTEYVEVELNDKEVYRLIEEKIQKVFDLPRYCYINDKNELIEEIEYHGSHSWTEKEKIRNATLEDVAALKVLSAIREFDRKK